MSAEPTLPDIRPDAMRLPTHFSIKTKLNLLAISAASIALLFSSAAFFYTDVQRIRSSTVTQLSALASVVGANSTAALQFDDSLSAAEMLESLQQQPAVEMAVLYDENDDVFATFSRSNAAVEASSKPPPSGAQFTEDGHLALAQPIIHDSRTVGTIYVHSSLEEVNEQFLRHAVIVAVIFVVALAVTAMISSYLQRIISRPVLELADTARRVSTTRDFSLRVVKHFDDELGVLFDQFNSMLSEIQLGESELQNARDELERRVEERTAQLTRSNEELSREVTERIRAETELEETHHQLMATARRAGMAEIATGVLHNVGNVLNGINVSATLMVERLRQSKIDQLGRAVNLLEEHDDDLGQFLSSDSKGQQVPQFLRIVTDHLLEEQREITEEANTLATKVDHVKAIIATQQTYAGATGVIQTFDIADVLEESIKLQAASFERHRITIRREFTKLPPILADKERLLQIFVNLVKNAKEAMQDAHTENTLTFRTLLVDENVRAEISDTGVGIAEENITRVFSHGFTTKASGHGFGLHSCANAAQAMGGSLSVISDGPGMGSTFVLVLPLKTPCKKMMV